MRVSQWCLGAILKTEGLGITIRERRDMGLMAYLGNVG